MDKIQSMIVDKKVLNISKDDDNNLYFNRDELSDIMNLIDIKTDEYIPIGKVKELLEDELDKNYKSVLFGFYQMLSVLDRTPSLIFMIKKGKSD